MPIAPDEESALRHTLDVIEGVAPASPEMIRELDRTIRAHRPKVYATCFRIVRNSERAEDLTQEALTTAYRTLASYRGTSQLSSWLCGIARNLCLNAVRKRGELLTEDGIVEGVDGSAEVLRAISRQERNLVLAEASRAVLDAEEQEIVHLRYVENLPYDSIESVLGLTGANGTRVALQRIKRKLHRELTRRLEELGHGMSFVRSTL